MAEATLTATAIAVMGVSGVIIVVCGGIVLYSVWDYIW